MQATAEPGGGEVAASTPERPREVAPPSTPARLRAERLLRVSRVVSDLERAESFYAHALSFQAIARGAVETEQLWALGARYAVAQQVVMRLGDEEIALVQFSTPGRPYPADSRSDDLWFQHLAIVVESMDAAYAQLCQHPGWRPITEVGPQTLPPSNGSVRAFKFRDPDGHPLELLWFPARAGRPLWHSHDVHGAPFLGIDHTALAVRSTRSSLGFYRTLGMQLEQRSLNRGAAQSHLDALPDARVRVTSLRPLADTGPGIELLAYRPPGRAALARSPTDIASDWVTLAFGPGGDASREPSSRKSQRRPPVALADPDGHRLLLVDQSSERSASA